MISRKAGVRSLLVLTLFVAGVFFWLPRIPQPLAYHSFADQRDYLGIANFWNVISNLPFAVIGLWGLVFLLKSDSAQTNEHFIDPRERWLYLFVFVGLLLTAVGSSYYHLDPNNARLVWDRLPMTIAFMSMVAAVIADRISLRLSLWLLPIFLFVGVSSVLQWYASETRGTGDLRFYAAVQVYSALILLVAPFIPTHYSHGSDVWMVLGFYILAKVFETLDKRIFAIGHTVSGHTLKHLAAATAGYCILRMVQKRRPIATKSAIAQRI